MRVNHRIRVPQVRCISDTGEQIGVLSTSEALRLAESRGMDLVEISPNAQPPVCRIMNFGKYRYEESRKKKLARKNQSTTVVKEIKFHLNVEEHDYTTKLNRIKDFLQKGQRVKVSLMFRGRENEHRELGYALFERLQNDCEKAGVAESPPKLFGNNLVMLLKPQK
ncbi:MAG: translation initiation factor IF-3 [Kiritimatiellia bacterium]